MTILFVASEAFFFISLIVSYLYYHNQASTGPASVQSLDIESTGIFTLFLLGSSLTMWRARKGLERQQPGAFKGWLLTTIVFGIVFLVGQGREYLHLYHEDVTVSRNIFGSSFFTLTGFHGLHVLIGLILLTILFGLALAGDFEDAESPAIESAEIYWHFVDAVWIVVFTVVYVIPKIT